MQKEEIRKELLQIGYNPIHIGTTYLIEAINIIYTSNLSTRNFSLEKDIYSKLAKKYNKNIRTIKSDIIKSTNSINPDDIYMKRQYHIHNLKNIKLTPKLVIVLIINKIELDYLV